MTLQFEIDGSQHSCSGSLPGATKGAAARKQQARAGSSSPATAAPKLQGPMPRGAQHLGTLFLGTGTAGGSGRAESSAVIMGSWRERQREAGLNQVAAELKRKNSPCSLWHVR